MDLIKVSKKLIESNMDFYFSYIIFNGISITKQNSPILEKYVAEVKEKIKKNYKLEALKNDEIVRKYRDFYWHYLNIDPTKIRPSSEALIRRILAEKPIPQINSIVDLNNWVSIDTLIPLGAYDLDILKPPLILRFSQEGEDFVPIGGSQKKMKGNEIILTDDNSLIIHQYPHRDSDISKISLKTKNMLVVACGVPGISTIDLEHSLIIFRDLLKKMSEKQFSYSKIYSIK